MREQQTQERSHLRGFSAAGVMLVGLFFPLFGLLIAFTLTPPEWGVVVGLCTLLLIGLLFLLLWYLPPTGLFNALQHALLMSLLMDMVIATGFLTSDLEALYDPRHQEQDHLIGLGLGIVSGLLLFIPCLLLLRRRWQQRQIEIIERYSVTEALVASAFFRASDGWGLPPEEALRKGRVKIMQGVIFGGFWMIEGLSLFIGLSFLPLRPFDRLYLVLAFLIACGGVCLLVAFCRPGARLLRRWKTLRGHSQETITLEGEVEEIWMQDAALPSSPGNLSVIKLNLANGSSTFLLATSRAFPKDMPEQWEENEKKMLVSIDYLPDAEVVVRVILL